MCCNQGGLISRIPTVTRSPLPSLSPPFSPITHFRNPTRIPIHKSGISSSSSRSFRTPAAAAGAAVNDAPLFMEDVSFYELLGIPETVTSVEIKQAYKQLARKYHPDVSPPGRAEEYTQRFIRVQEAYETLSDPNLRALYDRDMAMGLHLAFSTRNQLRSVEEMKEKGEWRGRWQSQLSELKRRSMYKESCKSSSWAARIRRQRNESSS